MGKDQRDEGRRRPIRVEELRERLEQERQAAIDELKRLGVSADLDETRPRELDPASITEAGDAAQASERRDMAYARRERLAGRINDLTAALGRLASGTYTRCEICGGLIEPERLAALPEARTCLTCQERLESGGGLDAA